MHCRSFAADLDLLASGVLPMDRTPAVEAHLGGCTACRDRYARTLVLCAELSAAGRAAEPPEAAAWRLRNGVRTAISAPGSGSTRRWQIAAALATGLACVLLLVYRAMPPAHPTRPAEMSSAIPPVPDPPLTLLACERAAARSDAALDQLLSRDAARTQAVTGDQPLRAFAPNFAALDRDDPIP